MGRYKWEIYGRYQHLSRRHFEHVLAGNPPEPVAYNVRRFLSQIRARRRWSLHTGFALAPDTNIGATSDESIIYTDIGGQPLPFRRDAEELTTSGIGLSLWTGGEYQYPLDEGLRLRAGANVSRREYGVAGSTRPSCRGTRGRAGSPGPEHGGERADERAAALERRSAGLRPPRGPSRGWAQVHPAGDGDRADIVARPATTGRGPTSTGRSPTSHSAAPGW